MSAGEFRIGVELPTSDGVAELLLERDGYFDRLYAEEDRNARPVDLEEKALVFIAIRNADELVGCGALVVRSGFGELKRFYLRAEFRGQGLGRRLVQVIETEARRHGCPKLMLETGALQPDAIALYRGQGFNERGPFGEYAEDPLSVFMEKTVTPRQ
ncbi:GNAT family N-acetyltransferase [Phenylobacterium sp.]|uniref:GNAT family N-acetyltransferase n=1 Tax=Phenylobacterium sp. TaxID=1871053 RepID=UPI002736FD22|nr:GNAT family N-acetyltransferase [Phenylobacterium sp.]MDP3854663.1 GNAT family N-acetyltransferase [Phenylobacterium sp.]